MVVLEAITIGAIYAYVTKSDELAAAKRAAAEATVAAASAADKVEPIVSRLRQELSEAKEAAAHASMKIHDEVQQRLQLQAVLEQQASLMKRLVEEAESKVHARELQISKLSEQMSHMNKSFEASLQNMQRQIADKVATPAKAVNGTSTVVPIAYRPTPPAPTNTISQQQQRSSSSSSLSLGHVMVGVMVGVGAVYAVSKIVRWRRLAAARARREAAAADPSAADTTTDLWDPQPPSPAARTSSPATTRPTTALNGAPLAAGVHYTCIVVDGVPTLVPTAQLQPVVPTMGVAVPASAK